MDRNSLVAFSSTASNLVAGDTNGSDVFVAVRPADACPLDPAKLLPGECGCGIADADSDTDGVADCFDNCPYYATGIATDADQDGRGDACECSDQNGDGFNTVSDLIAISDAIFNPVLATPLCDGNNDGECDVRDITAAWVQIFSAGNTTTCGRYPVRGP